MATAMVKGAVGRPGERRRIGPAKAETWARHLAGDWLKSGQSECLQNDTGAARQPFSVATLRGTPRGSVSAGASVVFDSSI